MKDSLKKNEVTVMVKNMFIQGIFQQKLLYFEGRVTQFTTHLGLSNILRILKLNWRLFKNQFFFVEKLQYIFLVIYLK